MEKSQVQARDLAKAGGKIREAMSKGMSPRASDMAMLGAHVHECTKVPELRGDAAAQTNEMMAYGVAGLIFAIDRAAERICCSIDALTEATRELNP